MTRPAPSQETRCAKEGWAVKWLHHREFFVSPEGRLYERTRGAPDLEVEVFVPGRTIKLRKYDPNRRMLAHERT